MKSLLTLIAISIAYSTSAFSMGAKPPVEYSLKYNFSSSLNCEIAREVVDMMASHLPAVITEMNCSDETREISVKGLKSKESKFSAYNSFVVISYEFGIEQAVVRFPENAGYKSVELAQAIVSLSNRALLLMTKKPGKVTCSVVRDTSITNGIIYASICY